MALIDPDNSALSKLGYSTETNFYEEFLNRASGVAQKIEATGESVEDLEEMSEEELEEWLWKHEGQGHNDILSEFKGMERTAENNYGYIDKPGIMSFAGFLPGIAGMIGGAANLFMNFSNVEAVNAARKDLGLPELTIAETIKGAVFGSSKVGQVTVDGKKVNVDLDPDKQKTDKKGVETVDAKTAKTGVDAVKADVARTAEPIQGTKAALPPVGTPTVTQGKALADITPTSNGLVAEPKLSMGSLRAAPPDDDILSLVDKSVKSVLGPDWTIDVTSGTYTDDKRNPDGSVKAGARGGTSDRHDHGKATDFAIVNPTTGQSLSRSNTPQEVFDDLAQAFSNNGAKGVGWGPGYMEEDGRSKFHIDTVRDTVWGAKGKSVNATQSIVEAVAKGKDMAPFPSNAYPEGIPVPTEREIGVARLDAQNTPVGKGFVDSPELAANKVETPTSIATTDVTPAQTSTGFVNPASEISEVNPDRFGTVPETQPSVSTQGTGFTGFETPEINSPAPSILGTETYGEQLGLWNNSPVNPVELTNVTPAQYAALGFVERTPEQIDAISKTLAGELSPKSLEDLTGVNGVDKQREAQTELANMVATVENREASGKFGNVLTGSQYNSNLSSNAKTTTNNYSIYSGVLNPLVESFYTPEGIKASNYAATHYYNPQIVTPSWSSKMTNTETVGKHTFGTLDSKYDVPVTDEFKSQVIDTQLDMLGNNVPTPSPAPSQVQDTGKGFVGSPEAQTSVATPMTDAMNTDITPSIDTSVDSGKSFGDSFGSGYGSQGKAGVSSGNVQGGEDEATGTGIESFSLGDSINGNFSAGTVGESPGATGQSEFSDAGGFMGGEEGAQESGQGSMSVTSLSTGETSTGSLGGSSSDSGSTGEGTSSLSDSLSEAFGGWGGDTEGESSTDSASSDGDDGEDSNSGW